jgi:hypothetical protein
MLTINNIKPLKEPSEKQIKFANDILTRVNAWLDECRIISEPITNTVEANLNNLKAQGGAVDVIFFLKDETKVSILFKCKAEARRQNSNECYSLFTNLIQKLNEEGDASGWVKGNAPNISDYLGELKDLKVCVNRKK